jgi:glutaredoxin
MDGVELIAENEFSKTFKYIDEINDIDIFIAKAYDDEQDKHYVVASIPYIKEVGSERVQFPFIFADEKDRDNGFDAFDVTFAKSFIIDLIQMIKNQAKENAEKNLQQNTEEVEQVELKQLSND